MNLKVESTAEQAATHLLGHPPLLICGVARSGTSYLRKLLNATSKLHLSYEGRMLKEGVSLHQRLKPSATVELFSNFLNQLAVAESEIHSNEQLITVVREHGGDLYSLWLKHHSYAELMAAIYVLAFHRPIWGDKLLRIEYAWQILTIWPGARFIILHRDPRAVSASQKVRGNIGLRIPTGYWNTHFNLSLRLRQEIPDQIHMVHYEELIAAPRQSLESVLRFISPGLEAEAAKALEQYPPQAASISKWQQTLSVEEIEKIEGMCYFNMIEMGYRPERATGPKRLSKVGYFWDNLWAYKRYLIRPTTLLRKHPWERLRMMLATAAKQKRERQR